MTTQVDELMVLHETAVNAWIRLTLQNETAQVVIDADAALRSAIVEALWQHDRMEEALHQIKTWAQAYPLAVFPEPDFAKAHEVLQAAGMTVDAISASNMRHIITRVQAIVDAALPAPPADALQQMEGER
jgi:hypothetical protein